MKRLALISFAVFACLAGPMPASALSVTCLPNPLPSTPAPPVYSMELFLSSEHSHLDLWRQPCQDGSGQTAVLIRVSPVSTGPFLCEVSFKVIQNGTQNSVDLRPTFCDDLFVPTTFILAERSSSQFDETGAFTLIYGGSPVTSMNVPAGSGGPGPFSISLVATGCTTCSAGQTIAYELHINNPGPPMMVELKVGVRLPNGSPVNLMGRYLEETLATGQSTLPLFAGPFPAGVPAGTYSVEAAAVEPELGVTLGRHSVPLQVR